MKKQQKEQIKVGGEIARKMYQEFLKKPEWLDVMSDDERKLAVAALLDYVSLETKSLKMFTAEYERLYQDGKDNHHQMRGEACSRAYRIGVLHKLECLLRYGGTEQLALYGYDN